MSGVGYIDGLMAEDKLSSRVSIGAFIGTQPQWQYSSFQTSMQKAGFYGSFTRGIFGATRYEMTLALAGEYHGKTVSREFAYLQNNFNVGSAWNFFQSGEMDINRGWRKTKTGTSLVLTNLYLSVRHRLSDRISLGLSFDSRKNYWSYGIRTLADSLFDNNLRQGAKTDLSLRLPNEYLLNGGFGYQKRQTDSKATNSYSLSMNKTNFLVNRFSINLQGAAFSGPFTNGSNLQIRLGRAIRKSDLLNIGYNIYIYKIPNGNIRRRNRSYSIGSQNALISRIYFNGSYEYDEGDDVKGHRFLGELGYHF